MDSTMPMAGSRKRITLPTSAKPFLGVFEIHPNGGTVAHRLGASDMKVMPLRPEIGNRTWHDLA